MGKMLKNNIKKEVFVSIVTTKGMDWKKEIKKLKILKIKRIALFLTCLNKKKRIQLYQALAKSPIETIPLVHIRDDMTEKELDYFFDRYKTKVFCLHDSFSSLKYLKYKKMIAIENVCNFSFNKNLKEIGGLCLDLSHLENDRLLNKKRFKKVIKALKSFSVIGNHVSAIKENIQFDKEDKELRKDQHYLKNLSELNYLKKYPQRYFSPFVAIELENPLEEQLQIKKQIEKLIFDNGNFIKNK